MQSVLAPDTSIEQKLIELAEKIDAFCSFPYGYSRQVAATCDRITAVLGLAAEDRQVLHEAAILRDVGQYKMGRDYINIPRILTADERNDIARHSVIGEQEAAKLELSRGVQLVIRWHHEWWNGGGYPDRLSGIHIPLKARILRVADAYNALISPRPFRAPYPVENAAKYMTEWAAIEFDPAVVKAFLSTLEDQ